VATNVTLYAPFAGKLRPLAFSSAFLSVYDNRSNKEHRNDYEQVPEKCGQHKFHQRSKKFGKQVATVFLRFFGHIDYLLMM
jgi:hypothetical protein